MLRLDGESSAHWVSRLKRSAESGASMEEVRAPAHVHVPRFLRDCIHAGEQKRTASYGRVLQMVARCCHALQGTFPDPVPHLLPLHPCHTFTSAPPLQFN